MIGGDYKTTIIVKRTDEMDQLSHDFNSLANTLSENEKSRRQWISDISHKLRTPLAVLKGEIEAIQDGIREVTIDRIDSLHAEVEQLSHLVSDLYALSMSDIGALNYHKEQVDPIDVLKETIDSFRGKFDKQQITLSWQCENNEEIVLLADAARIKQLFSNIMKNTLRDSDTAAQKITASFGISQYRLGESIQSFINRADQALYKAKVAGRNSFTDL